MGTRLQELMGDGALLNLERRECMKITWEPIGWNRVAFRPLAISKSRTSRVELYSGARRLTMYARKKRTTWVRTFRTLYEYKTRTCLVKSIYTRILVAYRRARIKESRTRVRTFPTYVRKQNEDWSVVMNFCSGTLHSTMYARTRNFPNYSRSRTNAGRVHHFVRALEYMVENITDSFQFSLTSEPLIKRCCFEYKLHCLQ